MTNSTRAVRSQKASKEPERGYPLAGGVRPGAPRERRKGACGLPLLRIRCSVPPSSSQDDLKLDLFLLA